MKKQSQFAVFLLVIGAIGVAVLAAGLFGLQKLSAKSGAQRWTYLPAAGDPETITTIRFANGVVTAVDRKVSR